MSPGILSGFNLIAYSSSIIGIEPGSAMTDSGVLIIEDELQQYPFTQSINPANYTIYYSYAPSLNFGGNPAVLNIQIGLIDPANFSNGVILGWLLYPGSSAPLNTSMFVSAPRLKLTEPSQKVINNFITDYPPFVPKLTLASVAGPSLTVTDSYDGANFCPITTFTNAAGSLSTSVYLLPFKVPLYGLGQVLLELSTQTGALLTVTILRRDGSEVTPNGVNYYTNSTMFKNVLSIPQGILSPNEDVCLKLQMAIQPTFNVVVRSLGISSYTEPF